MNDLEERFSGALHNTARAWRHAVDRRLKDLGVSQAAWMAVATAARASEPLSQSELAQRLGVEGASMVSMIDRLVRAGLFERAPSAADRRVKLVIVTEAGKALNRKVQAEAERFRKEVLAGVEREQLQAATALLEHLQRVAESVT